MPFETITIIRLCGIAGIVGALLTGIGDLLYNHIPGSTQTLYEKMSTFTQKRLVTAGLMGLIGCWLYLFSVPHLYYAFLPAGEGLAWTLSIAFALVAAAYGVGHAAYYAIGSAVKVAKDHQLDVEAAGKQGAALFPKIVLLTYLPVSVVSILMIYGVVTAGSAYPVWMFIFLPIIPYLLRPIVLKVLRGRVHELIRDSYDNFVLLLYFFVSTLVLWRFQ